jgi:hypothetical protein
MRHVIFKFAALLVIVLSAGFRSYSQEALPDVFKKETIPEQLKYLEDHTRIYQNYRAIREDMFQSITKNTNDTISKARSRINHLIQRTNVLNNRIDSLKKSQEGFNAQLSEVTRLKDSITVVGLAINKKTYNTFMWTVVGVLVLLLLIGYLTFRQNRIVTLRTKKDLVDLKDEYEKYQKKTRLEREKMTIDHFNEIKKLRGT